MNISPKLFLWILLATSAIIGALRPHVSGEILGTAQWAIVAVVLFGWCKAHVQKSRVKEPPGSALLFVILSVVGVPIYFYRAFGLKGGTLRTLKALLFFLLLITVEVITEVASKRAS